MSYGYPECFPFQDTIYTIDNFQRNAFSYFPQHVYGRELSEKERIDLLTQQYQQYLEKHECWHYEQEARIILGALMNGQQKARFREISRHRMDRIAHDCKNSVVFDFVLFEAKLPNDRREITIEAEEIFTLSGS